MPNPDEAKKSNKDASDLLMEDFHQFAESFWKNEQTGETRVNWFIGIVAAAAGGLFGLSSAEHGPSGAQLRLIVVVSLFALLAFGIGTLFRMIKRNATTDEKFTTLPRPCATISGMTWRQHRNGPLRSRLMV